MFTFSLIRDVESGVDQCHFILARQSSASSELFTAGRWHDVNMQVPSIKLSSLELVEHQMKYKAIFQVVNKAGLSTTVKSSKFMWDESPPGWSQSPSSLSSKLSMSGGLRYVHVGDQVQFSWASPHAGYFSVAICISSVISTLSHNT